MSTGMSAPLRHVVLDAAPLLSDNTPFLHQLVANGCELWTIPEVLEEVQDRRSKATLCALPFKISTRAISADAMSRAVAFAKLTGDYYVLSAADLRVIALTLMIEREEHGDVHLRSAPKHSMRIDGRRVVVDKAPKVTVASIDSIDATQEGQEIADVGEVNIEEEGQENEEEDPEEDESEKENAQEGEEEQDPVPSLLELSLNSTKKGDDDDGEGEWITGANLAMQLQGAREAVPDDAALPPSTVSCISTDFALQNVLLQLGLRLTSLDGRQISSIAQWILRCFACTRMTMDLSRVFCDNCGGNTMARTRVKVTKGGWVKYRHATRKISNLRGTIFSVPKPKGGRKNTDMILRADQIPIPKFRSKKDTIDQFFDEASEFAFRDVRASGGHGRVGHPRGKKANEALKKTGKHSKRRT